MNSPLPSPDAASNLPPPVPSPGYEPPPIPTSPPSTVPDVPPQSSFVPPPVEPPPPAAFPTTSSATLASPLMRLVAQIIDIAVIIIPAMILGFITMGKLPAFLFHLLVGAILVGINWNFLLNGQTIGKKVLKLKIVMEDGSPADRMHLVKMRMAPLWLVTAIPYVGWLGGLADALCIFRPGHQTLHDELAKTKVIQLPQ